MQCQIADEPSEGREVRELFFADAFPGPPVEMTLVVDGVVRDTMSQLERVPPTGG